MTSLARNPGMRVCTYICTLAFLPRFSLLGEHAVIDNEDVVFLISLLACRSAEEVAESPITTRAPGFQDFTSPLKGKKKRQLPIAPRRRGRAASGEDEGEEWGKRRGGRTLHVHNMFCEVQV